MSSQANEQTATSTRPAKRRNPLLRARFQLKYAFLFVLVTMVGSTLIGSVAFGLLHKQARDRVLNVADPAAVSTLDTTWSLIGYTAAITLLLSVVVGFWVVRVTHRVVGPLWVIEQSLGELAAGRWPKRRPLRQNDELKDFHACFWQALDAIHDRRKADLEKLVKARQDAKSVLDGDPGRTRQNLVCVTGALDDLCNSTAESIGEAIDPSTSSTTKPRSRATAPVAGSA